MLLKLFLCAGNQNRTGTAVKCRGILSPLCLPIPPSRQQLQSDLQQSYTIGNDGFGQYVLLETA